MTRKEYCQRIADFNEAIYDTENAISDIESRLRWDDESKKNWYLNRLEKAKAELSDINSRLSAFQSEYGYLFWEK